MIARSEIFANITLFVIAANAIYIGVDADNNEADGGSTYQPEDISANGQLRVPLQGMPIAG